MTTNQPAVRAVRLFMENGSVLCRQYNASGATAGVIWLGGMRGGMDSPTGDLFDRLAAKLAEQHISSLRIRYRQPNDLERCVEDALLGIQFLVQSGIYRLVLVGYSMGGAVAIEAGASSPEAVKGVAVIASQSYGAGAANRITPRPLLIIQGENDKVIPSECATYIFQRAEEPKELVVIRGGDHTFQQHSDELGRILEAFVIRSFSDSGTLPPDRPL